MITEDQERWVEALAIERWKGVGAIRFLAARIEALAAAVANDETVVTRLKIITDRLDCPREGFRH